MSTEAFGARPERSPAQSGVGSPAIREARRQLEICNACRYCEGYCSVFPAMTLHRVFPDGEVTQLANLCHNCRGCYFACQYVEPHEFGLNLPAALADVRLESWERFIWPSGLASIFQKSGVAVAAVLVAAIGFMLFIAGTLRPASGEGFYAVISHSVMAGLFTAATVLPLAVLSVGVWRYWRHVGGERLTLGHVRDALADAGMLRNLSGGAARGCNYEKDDHFTMVRRWAHQAVMWGFVLCFASTTSGTVLHYGLGLEAPYGPLALPKLLGVPGGVAMTIGGGWLILLKLRADRALGARAAWGGEMAFALLLAAAAMTGLALYWGATPATVHPLLVVHLGTVLALYLTAPYGKMAHVPFRLAALLRDAQTRKRR